MKPSERIRQGFQDLQNAIYYRLHPGGQAAVDKAYRAQQRAKPFLQRHAEQAKTDLRRKVLGTSDDMRTFAAREFVGITPQKKRRVVGSK